MTNQDYDNAMMNQDYHNAMMKQYEAIDVIEDTISRTLVGGAAILCILSILLLIGLLIGLFGFLTFIGILVGLSLFLFLSHWVGKWFVG